MAEMRLSRLISVLLLAFIATGCTARSTGMGQGSSQASSKVIIQNSGSDTMVNLALAWSDQYQKANPGLSISVSGGGSGTGIAALINGTTDIANASRKIKQEEIDEAEKNGKKPVEFVVARDAIAVIVHKDNPITRLTLQQISDIYSGKYTNWNQLGGEDRPIVRVSRETNSGTHVYFLEQVLRLGQKDNKTMFSTDTMLLPSSEGIISEVRQNPNAIGYDGLGYVTPDVKVIAVAQDEGGHYVSPSAESVNQGSYPIARELYMYTAGQPSSAIQQYLDWIISPTGQNIVTENGFVPIQASSP
jgi:phosphate transport system substrate-binding protein